MKHLTGFLAFFPFLVLPLYAADLSDLTYTTTGGEVAITDCNTEASGALTIPDTIEGSPVTSIADYAFAQCTSLTAVTIPEGVTSIGNFGFFRCIEMHTITIPETVIGIGSSAFASCSSLAAITIPDGITSIAGFTFYNCSSLTRIAIPDGVTSIGEVAFDKCTALNGITFHGPAPTVGEDAFDRVGTTTKALVTMEALGSFGGSPAVWQGLQVIPMLSYIMSGGSVSVADCDEDTSGALVVPDTIQGKPVTSIRNYAFRDCHALTEITIPDGVTSLGVGTFFESTGLTKVTLPEGILTLPLYTFYGCRSLVDITIPGSVSTLGSYAFAECTNLTEITIPDGVTSIGELAFFTCTGLTAITIPSSVASIDTWAFYNCTRLTNVTFRGAAPTTNREPFLVVPGGARALVPVEVLSSFGSFGNDWEGLTLSPIPEQEAYLAPLIAERDAARAERDARPTTEELATVEAERDARYTEDQIRALSPDYTMGLNEAGNVEVKISFIASSDATNFAPFSVTGDSLSVVDGKVCIELPPDQGAFFYRFRIE